MFDDLTDQDARPPRSRLRRASWSVALGGCVLLVALVFAWIGFAQHAPPIRSGGDTVIGTPSAPKVGAPDPPIYWQTIEQQIAQGLHLTVAQVKARLQPPPGQRDGPSIAVIATQQGIPEAQWREIEINAIQKGHDLLVRMDYLTQAGSDQGMRTIHSWDQSTLDDHVTRWFLND